MSAELKSSLVFSVVDVGNLNLSCAYVSQATRGKAVRSRSKAEAGASLDGRAHPQSSEINCPRSLRGGDRRSKEPIGGAPTSHRRVGHTHELYRKRLCLRHRRRQTHAIVPAG